MQTLLGGHSIGRCQHRRSAFDVPDVCLVPHSLRTRVHGTLVGKYWSPCRYCILFCASKKSTRPLIKLKHNGSSNGFSNMPFVSLFHSRGKPAGPAAGAQTTPQVAGSQARPSPNQPEPVSQATSVGQHGVGQEIQTEGGCLGGSKCIVM